MSLEARARFVRWNTPFTDCRWPGTALYTSQESLSGVFAVTAVVMPSGVDKYPKYLVHFGEVIAFTCMEESHFPERDFADAACEEEGLSAYEYLNSSWLKAYESGEHFLYNVDFSGTEKLKHFLIIGGDNNIEVITKNNPHFETIDSPRLLDVIFAV